MRPSRLFQRALKIEQAVLGPNHVFSASGNANLGDVSLARGHWAAARGFYREAIRLITGQDTSYEIIRRMVENEIREFRDTFVGLCRSLWQLRSEPGADKAAMIEETFVAGQLAWQTSAAAALAKMTARLGTSDTDLGRRIRSVQDNADKVLALHDEDQKLLTEWYAVQMASTAYSTALEEFRAASIARNRDQAPNIKRQTELVQRMTALLDQCPPGQKKAGCDNADRERGVIGKELRELNEATGKGAGDIMAIHARMEAAEKVLPGYDRFNTRRTAVRADIDRAERAAREERARISRSYPDYVALAEPRPLSASAVQALLKDDEALVAILVGSTKSFVWALSRGRAEWAEIDAGSAALAEHVAVLRNGLDPLAQQDAEGTAGSRAGVVQGFDLIRAHALYKLVLGPVASVLAGKQHLIVVPTGPLTSIPFQVLITAPPGPQTGADALRDAAWLIKTHALSVLPSVQSLNALRTLGASGTAVKPFFGVGDPVLDGPSGPRQRGARRASAIPVSFYRNGLADTRAVRELAPLPDTADELRAIGKVLGATPDAINLREAASETRVKAAPLEDYRVIQFATHGLVAGDLSGLAEPALVLTPPPVATEADDGLLDGLGNRCAEAERRLGRAVCLQHGVGCKRGRRGAFRACTRFLLCGRPRTPCLALGSVFPGGDGTHDRDLHLPRRHTEGGPRRGLPQRHAGIDREGRAAFLLGAVRDRGRGWKPRAVMPGKCLSSGLLVVPVLGTGIQSSTSWSKLTDGTRVRGPG